MTKFTMLMIFTIFIVGFLEICCQTSEVLSLIIFKTDNFYVYYPIAVSIFLFVMIMIRKFMKQTKDFED